MASAKPDKQAAKLEARKERNEAQAAIERDIWASVNNQAEQAVAISRGKHGVSYTVELGQEVITRLSNGQSLHSICKLEHMPHIATIYDWIAKEPSFGEHYGRAREQAAHTLFDQMLDIADDSSADLLEDGTPNSAAIARARLQIETRARVAGKLAPKVYGERLEALTQSVNITNNNLSIDASSLGADQRNALRNALIAARDSKTIDN